MILKPKFRPADPTPQEMATVADGARMAHMLPYMQETIQTQLNVIQTKVYAAIANGTLTPEMALTAWHEMAANHNLLKRYTLHVKLGTNVAEKHSTTLTIGE
jgi:hypothetical protein